MHSKCLESFLPFCCMLPAIFLASTSVTNIRVLPGSMRMPSKCIKPDRTADVFRCCSCGGVGWAADLALRSKCLFWMFQPWWGGSKKAAAQTSSICWQACENKPLLQSMPSSWCYRGGMVWQCRVVEEYMLHVGGSIGYWQGDVKKLMDDIAALRPTVFVGVPRVFERICGGINDLVSISAGWPGSAFEPDGPIQWA